MRGYGDAVALGMGLFWRMPPLAGHSCPHLPASPRAISVAPSGDKSWSMPVTEKRPDGMRQTVRQGQQSSGIRNGRPCECRESCESKVGPERTFATFAGFAGAADFALRTKPSKSRPMSATLAGGNDAPDVPTMRAIQLSTTADLACPASALQFLHRSIESSALANA